MSSSRARVLTVVLVVCAFAAGFVVRGMMVDDARDVDPRARQRAEVPRRAPAPRRAMAPDEAFEDDANREATLPVGDLFGVPRTSGAFDGDRESANDVDVSGPPGLRLRGRCIDASGTPLRADVRVAGGSAIATDADGRFDLRGVDGAAREVSFAPIAGRQAWQRLPLRAPVDGVVEQGDVVLREGVTLRGRFTDLDGRPLPRATVILHIADIGWFTRNTTTDDAGNFAFEHVGDGFVVVSGRSPGCRLDGHDAWVHLPQRDGRDVALRVLSAHYARIVYTSESGAVMTLRQGTWRWYALDDASDSAEGSWTDSPPWDGIRLPVRVGATYEVRFETDGYLPVIERFEAGEEYERRVPLVLRPVAR